MNAKDWQQVNQQLMGDARRRLGDPPTAEELEAYTRGELSPEEEERMRALLVCYPELAHTLTIAMPDEEARPGEPGYVSDDALARRRAEMQQRLGLGRDEQREEQGRVVPFRRFQLAMAAAAMIVIGLGALSLQQHRRVRALMEPELLQPMRLQSTEGRRGPAADGSQALPAEQSGYLLEVPVPDGRFEEYRVAIHDAQTNERRWMSDPMPLDDDGALSIQLRRGFLEPGRYRIVVTGNGSEEEVTTYAIVIPSQSGDSASVPRSSSGG